MNNKIKKTITEIIMALLTLWTAICFYIGLATTIVHSSLQNFDYIITILLSGILSGMLAILVYFFWRMRVE